MYHYVSLYVSLCITIDGIMYSYIVSGILFFPYTIPFTEDDDHGSQKDDLCWDGYDHGIGSTSLMGHMYI